MIKMLATTLSDIKKCKPNAGLWNKLLFGLGVMKADKKPLPLEKILDTSGLLHALWALQAVKGHDRAIRLYACYCAKSVLHIWEQEFPDDDRPRKAIETAEHFALGRATEEELGFAENAARAAGDAAWFAAERIKSAAGDAKAAIWIVEAPAWVADAAAKSAARAVGMTALNVVWAAARGAAGRAAWRSVNENLMAAQAAMIDNSGASSIAGVSAAAWAVAGHAAWLNAMDELVSASIASTRPAEKASVDVDTMFDIYLPAAAVSTPAHVAVDVSWKDFRREFLRLCRLKGKYGYAAWMERKYGAVGFSYSIPR